MNDTGPRGNEEHSGDGQAPRRGGSVVPLLRRLARPILIVLAALGPLSAAITLWQFVTTTAEYRVEHWTWRVADLPETDPNYEIGVLADGKPIVVEGGGLSLETVTIWNSGRESLVRDDFRSPFTIDFSQCVVRAAKLIGQSALGTDGFEVDFVPSADRPTSAIVKFQHFDPQEAFKLAFVGSCRDRVGFVIESPKLPRVEGYVPWTLLLVGGALGLLGLGSISLSELVMEIAKPRFGKVGAFLVGLIPVGIGALMLGLIYFYGSALAGIPLSGIGPA